MFGEIGGLHFSFQEFPSGSLALDREQPEALIVQEYCLDFQVN